ERSALTYPFRSLLDAGVELVFSSDCPVSAYEPLKGIQAAVTEQTGSDRPYAPAEAISVDEGIRLYTLAGARASFEEADKGSIEVGKLADFAILADDPASVEPNRVADVPIRATVIGGVTVYEA
ncbi:MAG: amidohydrolase family protein, partial [Chloroflexota bacterium]|nr:amidohydrolase family protein [Chloroflexota bacterium]